jgi:hypothetical protein
MHRPQRDRRTILARAAIGATAVALVVTGALVSLHAEQQPSWSMNGTIIEACSCPMFCQCYFNSEPAGHHSHSHDGHAGTDHFCRFNNVVRVNEGHHGDTRLDGARFWVAGDLGGDFSEGKMDWAVVHFDPAVTAEQRAGILAALGPLYPVEWASFAVGEDLPIHWEASEERAVALLDGGKAGEVRLMRAPTAMGDGPVVINNLQYWGAPRNDGFVLMPNEVDAYRLGEKAFEYKGTNGFMITFDIGSHDAAHH